MKKDIKNWENHKFESSSYSTPEFNYFAKDLKAYIKDILPEGCKLHSFNKGHFYCSGFIISEENKYVYFSTSDVRHFPNDWVKNLLVRTAGHDKDYTGGRNNFCSIDKFSELVESLISEEVNK